MEIQRGFGGIAVTCLFVLMTGCSGTAVQSGVVTPVTPVTPTPNTINGVVYGGLLPISGATVQLYTVGTRGDGSTASALLSTAVTTSSTGSFSLDTAGTPLFSCTNATEVYLVATGGNPGTTQANANIALMAALGPCTGVTSGTKMVVNELTTVSAVSALAPYMSSATAIGSSSSDAAALASAFTLASEFASVSTGTSPGAGAPSGYTVPVADLNTLADIVVPCVNSTGGTSGDHSACGNLFSLTTPSGQSAPTNTAAALLYLAQNPTMNTQGLYMLLPANAPFQPVLTAQPVSFAAALAPAGVVLNPTSLTFASLPVGAASSSQTLSVANTTAASVALQGVAIMGANAADFMETNNCPGTLTGGAVCSVQVTFSPLATGTRSATLMVTEGATVASATLTGAASAASTGPVALSVTSLNFYQPNLQQMVTLSNYGSLPLAISAIQASAGFAEVNTCGNQLSAQSVCNIFVTANAGVGNFTGTLTIMDSDTADAQTVQLASYLNFSKSYFVGSVAVGSTFTSTTISGTAQLVPGYTKNGQPVYFYTDTFSGPNASDFNLANTNNGGCYVNGGGGGQCSVQVSTTPSATGYRYAVATGNDGVSYQLVSYGLSSTPSYFFNPMLLDFGSQAVGSSTVLTSTLNNGSTVQLLYQSQTYPNPPEPRLTTGALNNGDFNITGFACDSSTTGPVGGLAAGSAQAYFYTCRYQITFTPTTTGLRQATLQVTSSAGTTYSFPMQGGGTPAAPVLPAAVVVGNAQPGATTATYPVTATLQGKDAATAQISGAGFALVGPVYCAQGAAVCQFGVNFTPSALGTVTGTLTVTDAVTGLSSSTTLSGTGGVPVATLSPGSLTFVPRAVGTQSVAQPVTLTNMGNSPMSITSILITGTNASSFMLTHNCVSPLAVNASCTVQVTNTPQVAGAVSAMLTVASNAAMASTSIPLSGTGQ